MTDEQHDVVVVGGGPAGVSCALECFDIKLDVVLLEGGDALGGQVADIPHAVRNVAVGRFASGPAVQGAMEDAATILGDRARLGHAVSAVDVTAPAVEAAGTRFPARALVIATGAARRELPVAPDGAFGGDVSYLIESRPGWFAGRDVVVVGGGDSATLDALELAEAGSSRRIGSPMKANCTGWKSRSSRASPHLERWQDAARAACRAIDETSRRVDRRRVSAGNSRSAASW